MPVVKQCETGAKHLAKTENEKKADNAFQRYEKALKELAQALDTKAKK